MRPMTQKKERALQALLTTNTQTQAAKVANISAKTLYNYLHNDEEFKARYKSETERLVFNASDMLQKTFHPTIERLQTLVTDDSVPPSVQIQACRSVLEYGLKLIETCEIAERISKLEMHAEADRKRRARR